MADDIRPPDPEKGEGHAVTSVTETVPSEADADSTRYADEINRPPVSTNQPQTPIAQTLVAGAGAPQPVEGPLPEDWEPDGSGGAKVKEGVETPPVVAPQTASARTAAARARSED